MSVIIGRNSSSFFDWKAPSSQSQIIRSIKNSDTIEELQKVITNVKLSSDEQNEAIKRAIYFKALEINPNRELVFRINWDRQHPEDMVIAKDAILIFLHRIRRKVYSRSELKNIKDSDFYNFMIVPEIWSKEGQQTPLHFHGIINLPDRGLQWIDKLYDVNQNWNYVLGRYGLSGFIHVSKIVDVNNLCYYMTKQLNLDWISQNVILSKNDLKHKD